MPHASSKPIGILFEHPEWFLPLFAELDRRGVAYQAIPAHELVFDPSARVSPWALLVNRVSPSSYLRNHTAAIFTARDFLAHQEALGVPVVNGSRAYDFELSKAKQLALLAALGVPHPRSRVVNAPTQVLVAATQLEFPLIVKPNIGGSGALMRRFANHGELRAAADAGELDAIFGLDHTAVVQEYHPQKESSIVRVEALDGQLLYAIRIQNNPDEGFNLCPADICQVPEAASPAPAAADEFELCPVETPAKPGRKIGVAHPAPSTVDAVLRIFRAADIDVGGVEYLESERDGRLYVYDVNALSNFVTDAPRLVGFDPFVRFVDYLERRLAAASPSPTLSAS